MTKFKLFLAAAAIALPGTIAATGAAAQVSGVAVADPDAAIAGTKAWATARTQIQTTYKAQIDQAEARRTALQGEIQPLVTQFQTAQKAPGASDASLQPQYQAIQAKETAANQELGRLTAPVQRAQAYAIEQLRNKLPDAVQGAVRARNVSLLLSPQAALFAQPTADITSAITTELDRLVPTVSITPPAGWQPGQAGAAGAAPTAGTAVAPAAAAPRSSGRRNSSGR